MALADIHTYDLVPLALTWALFLGARAALRRRLDGGAAGRAAAAGAIAAVGVAYMGWVLRVDAVFAQRAAVLTISPPFSAYAVGYGGTLALAAWAGLSILRGRLRARDDDAGLLLCCWAAASLAAAYLPVPFQRKLVMGAHLPLAILAGLALSRLTRRLTGPRAAAAVGLMVGLLAPTNALFLWRDARAMEANAGPMRLYLLSGERSSLAWLRARAEAGDAVQPLPWLVETRPGEVHVSDVSLALYAPGLTGLRVQCGHEGETPRFRDSLYAWVRFCLPNTPERSRLAWLRASGVRWLVFSQKRDDGAPDIGFFRRPPPYLRRVAEASNDDADVFEVVLPAVSAARRRAPRAGRGT